jgi:hypothetical protein
VDRRRERSLEHYPLLAFFGTWLFTALYCAASGEPRLWAAGAATLPSLAAACAVALRVRRAARRRGRAR